MTKNRIKTSYSADEAFAYVADVTLKHYENFPVASLFLPAEKRPYIQSIYAFARTADDFADEDSLDSHTRLQKLDEWELQLKECYQGKAEHPIFIALHETVSKLSIPIEPLSDLLKAFKQDVQKNSYKNFNELLDYCKYSANPVGRLVLMIFGYKDEDYFKLSDKICTALQLTNFYQDVKVDLQKNRIYIPEDEIHSFGYSTNELTKHIYNDAYKKLMKHQIERTRSLFYEGAQLPLLVDKDLQLELKLVWFGGISILNKIEKRKYNMFSKHVKLSSLNKVVIFLRGLFYNDISKYRRRSLWDLT
ncbi:MAG: squalene synthase HpnC [Bacteroidota bacterium]|nr:squalene synthase HpnC [Bacteroidota bacterium]